MSGWLIVASDPAKISPIAAKGDRARGFVVGADLMMVGDLLGTSGDFMRFRPLP